MMDAHKLIEMNLRMAPMRIELELTEQCNLKCRFCYNSQNPIISDNVFDILNRLKENGIMEIVLTGGEPVSHPQFADILQFCCKHFSKVMVQTNGTYIDESVADLMKSCGVCSVNISLHGRKTSHEMLTLIPGSYEQAVLAIKRLVNRNITIASNFVLTSENIEDFPSTLAYLYNLGINGMTLTRFTPTGIGVANRDLVITIEQLISVLRHSDDFLKGKKDFFILLANAIPYCALPADLKHYSEYCHFGASRFYVDVNGNVMMCGMSRQKIGNILDNNFLEIKSSSALYCEHICGKDVPQKCQKCRFFSQCRGGCRAAAFAFSNQTNGYDPYCIEREYKINE